MDGVGVNLLHLLGYALMALGVIGVVLPFLPGPPLIWLGAFVWAWGDGFARLNWAILAALGALAALAWASDLLLTTTMSRRAGVSWKAIAGAVVGGLLGGFLLVGVPLIGALFGALLGAVLGMFVVEWLDKRNLRRALRAVWGYLVSTLLATLLKFAIVLAMLFIVAWRIWG